MEYIHVICNVKYGASMKSLSRKAVKIDSQKWVFKKEIVITYSCLKKITQTLEIDNNN